jgi:catechol 2,3-dioxygenase-like lactoylglutathione lyase family enzyme
MASRFTEVVVDAHDPRRLAEFWVEVLGYRIVDEGDEGEIEIGSWEPTAEAFREAVQPPTIIFVRVPEDKTVKNRVHLDVSPIDTTQEAEVERIVALGARHVDVGQGEQSWVVLADPEGNEFCVLRSLAPDA